jgi:hypothetical protein
MVIVEVMIDIRDIVLNNIIMNTNERWSKEEDQLLFEYVWRQSKYPHSLTMHSIRAMHEFKWCIRHKEWSRDIISLKRFGSCIDSRLSKYYTFIKRLHPDYTWSKTDFIPAFRNWHYLTNVAKDAVVQPKPSVAPKPIDLKREVCLNGITYIANIVSSCKRGCEKCMFFGDNLASSANICNAFHGSGFECTNFMKKYMPGFEYEAYFEKKVVKPIVKPFTINDVPENAILISKNGSQYKKYGNSVHANFWDNTARMLHWEQLKQTLNNDFTKKGDSPNIANWDIVSVKEITIGPELMQPKVFKYSVVDTEDAIVHTLESSKELHLIKEK